MTEEGFERKFTSLCQKKEMKAVGSILSALFLLFVFFCEGSLAQSANTYVSPTGTDSDDCADSSLPCKTIEYAFRKVAPGGTVCVAQGEYTETIQEVHISDKTIQGGWNSTFAERTLDPSLTVIRGNGDDPALDIIGGDHAIRLTIQNLTVSNCNGETCGIGIRLRALGPYEVKVSLLESIITDCDTGISIYSIYQGPLSVDFLVIMENCIIANNNKGIHASASYDGSIDMRFTNNTITNNLRRISIGSGMTVIADQGAKIKLESVNNIIWGNAGEDFGADLSLRKADDANLTVNCSYSNIGVLTNDGATYNEDDNLDDDPLFINVARGNYRISKNSPCKDAGICGKVFYSGGAYVQIRIAPFIDFEGDLRPLTYSLGCDIGADEWRPFISTISPVQLLLLND